jgi:hypothetical protein
MSPATSAAPWRSGSEAKIRADVDVSSSKYMLFTCPGTWSMLAARRCQLFGCEGIFLETSTHYSCPGPRGVCSLRRPKTRITSPLLIPRQEGQRPSRLQHEMPSGYPSAVTCLRNRGQE